MKIDRLIELLQEVKKHKGNIDMVLSSWCGTNNGYVQFDLEDPEEFTVSNYLNGLDQLVLGIEVTDSCKDDIRKGIKNMEELGYTYYLSQFVEKGSTPRSGISPCDWHNLW